MRKKDQIMPEIVIPKGYDVEDLLDTNDQGYDFEEPILTEEVKIRFGTDE